MWSDPTEENDHAHEKMMTQISERDGFIAALDQSGGSTPSALRLYDIPETAYNNDAEMFRLVHPMRVRISVRFAAR